jgi:hypothetical protein
MHGRGREIRIVFRADPRFKAYLPPPEP